MKLTRGEGERGKAGCWMVAIDHYHSNGASWSDQPACVDPTIRDLCILLNDGIADHLRERVIGPHLFAPLGTLAPRLLEERYMRAIGRIRELAMSVGRQWREEPAYTRSVKPAAVTALCERSQEVTISFSGNGIVLWRPLLPEMVQPLLDLILELCAMSTPTETLDPERQARTLREVCQA